MTTADSIIKTKKTNENHRGTFEVKKFPSLSKPQLREYMLKVAQRS